MKTGFVFLLVIAAIGGLAVYYFSKAGFSASPYIEFEANATFAVDGDTLQLEDGSRIRLLGINAPEKGQPKYSDAKALLSSLAANKTILVQSDIEKKDRYGRFLGYIFVGNTFVNEAMLEQGLAVAWFIEPNFRYQKELEESEAQAKENGAGLWNLAEGACLAVLSLHYDAEGNDNENLNDEYVVFGNVCDEPFPLAGWKVKDSANKAYAFPAVSLGEKASLTLHTGKGQNNSTDLFWGASQGIWNNDGDVLYLQAPDGSLALDYPYP
jgi:micrococcal nuclease